MEIPSYPSLGPIAALYPAPQIMLGRRLYWTEKRDGSQLKIWAENGVIKIATHHQYVASAQFVSYFESIETAKKVAELVTGADTIPGVSDFGPYLVVGELLVQGKSPARYETHATTEYVVFDLYDLGSERWLPIPLAYQTCLYYGVPFVEIWAESEHTSMESLMSFRDEMLKVAELHGREGVVVKTLSEYGPLYAKEKRDAVPIEKRHIKEGSIHLPALPDSEVLGAVAKVHSDTGDNFTQKAIAMPLVAKYVAEECAKHLCGKPTMPLFWYYQHYLEGLGE